MTSYNAANERMKRQYFAYLAEAQGHSEQTIDAVAKALARFEAYTPDIQGSVCFGWAAVFQSAQFPENVGAPGWTTLPVA
jgi:hypothetical protein